MNNNRDFSKNRSYDNKNKGEQNRPNLAEELSAIQNKRIIDKSFEETYADKALEVLKNIKPYEMISKAKIRSIYSILCDIIADEAGNSDNRILSKSVAALKLFRIHMIYDAGRDKNVKRFISETGVVGYLRDVEESAGKEKFNLYCKYFEALIAYHRFLNPKND